MAEGHFSPSQRAMVVPKGTSPRMLHIGKQCLNATIVPVVDDIIADLSVSLLSVDGKDAMSLLLH